jgi:heme/copper-type cytochrome/quinol oxidase subunit 2
MFLWLFPVDTNVRVMVTADDVLHSWAVPSFGVKVDCVPGRLNQVHVTVNRLGHFFGQCSELCGVNHAQMPIEIFATDLDTFEKGAGVVKEKNILGL